jgi:hypothetical protein
MRQWPARERAKMEVEANGLRARASHGAASKNAGRRAGKKDD